MIRALNILVRIEIRATGRRTTDDNRAFNTLVRIELPAMDRWHPERRPEGCGLAVELCVRRFGDSALQIGQGSACSNCSDTLSYADIRLLTSRRERHGATSQVHYSTNVLYCQVKMDGELRQSRLVLPVPVHEGESVIWDLDSLYPPKRTEDGAQSKRQGRER